MVFVGLCNVLFAQLLLDLLRPGDGRPNLSFSRLDGFVKAVREISPLH